MRTIDADALKEEVNKKKVVGRFNTLLLIDNAPAIEPEYKIIPIAKVTFDEDKLKEIIQTEIIDKIKSGELAMQVEEQPIGGCRTCKYRDPEGKTCDRLFPISDNYFCEFYKESNNLKREEK